MRRHITDRTDDCLRCALSYVLNVDADTLPLFTDNPYWLLNLKYFLLGLGKTLKVTSAMSNAPNGS